MDKAKIRKRMIISKLNIYIYIFFISYERETYREIIQVMRGAGVPQFSSMWNFASLNTESQRLSFRCSNIFVNGWREERKGSYVLRLGNDFRTLIFSLHLLFTLSFVILLFISSINFVLFQNCPFFYWIWSAGLGHT